MAGKYNKDIFEFTSSQKVMLSEWILDSINEKKWENFDDLHIDEIINDTIPEDIWIEVSLVTIRFANQEIVRLGFDDIIPIMFIPLYCDENKKGVNFKNLNSFKEELDITPPSLVLCPENRKEFRDMFSRREALYDVLYKDHLYSVYYYEELNPNSLEYMRNLSLIPKDRIIHLQNSGLISDPKKKSRM